jgi:hypothetical protein
LPDELPPPTCRAGRDHSVVYPGIACSRDAGRFRGTGKGTIAAGQHRTGGQLLLAMPCDLGCHEGLAPCGPNHRSEQGSLPALAHPGSVPALPLLSARQHSFGATRFIVTPLGSASFSLG